MKRNPDLSRAILLFIEEHWQPTRGLERRAEIPGYDYPTILEHIRLLIDEGLVEGRMLDTLAGPHEAIITRLTASGHDATEAARSAAAWDRAKKIAEELALPSTFSSLVEIVNEEARRQLGSR